MSLLTKNCDSLYFEYAAKKMADDDQTLFVMTKRVKEALELINALDESKLAVIVKRLVKNVGEKGAPFTTEELEQLQDLLSLAEGQV